MTGKFSFALNTGNNNGNSNGNTSFLGGIRVIEITTPSYEVKEEDMGAMLLLNIDCELDFSKVKKTSTFIIYLIRKDNLEQPTIKFKSINKELVGQDDYNYIQNPIFVVIHNNKLFTLPIS